MSKLVLLAALVIVGCKLVLGRWPWELGADSAARQAERKARALLGVGKDAGHAEVIEAHRRLIAMVHPDRGGTNAQVHEANDARDLLLTRLTQG
jgi:hypothetical protein